MTPHEASLRKLSSCVVRRFMIRTPGIGNDRDDMMLEMGIHELAHCADFDIQFWCGAHADDAEGIVSERFDAMRSGPAPLSDEAECRALAIEMHVVRALRIDLPASVIYDFALDNMKSALYRKRARLRRRVTSHRDTATTRERAAQVLRWLALAVHEPVATDYRRLDYVQAYDRALGRYRRRAAVAAAARLGAL